MADKCALDLRILCVGAENPARRNPLMLRLRDQGLEIDAVETGKPARFVGAGLDRRRCRLERLVDPRAHLKALDAPLVRKDLQQWSRR